MKTVLKRIESYFTAGKWDSYLVILPTSLLVNNFAEELLADGGPQGILWPRIYTFESFIDMVLAGSLSSAIWIGETEKSEILRTIISDWQRNNLCHYFTNTEKYPGIIQAVSRTIGELKRAFILPDRFKKAIKNNCCNSPKLQDLSLLYEVYQQFLLVNHIGDRDDRYLEALNLLTEKRIAWLNNVEFAYIDWFEDPTGVQKEVFQFIRQIIPEVKFGSAENTRSVKLPDTHLLKGWGREGEVRLVAGLIKRMVREDNLSLDEIVLVCRDPAAYSSPLRQVFAEAGIPLCLDWKESLSENRMVESLLILLAAAGSQTGINLWELLDNTYISGNDNQVAECLAAWSRSSTELQPREWLSRLETEKTDWTNCRLEASWDKCFNWLQGFINIFTSICRQGRISDIINSIRAAWEKLQIEKNILELPEDITLEEKITLVRRDLRAWQAFNGILNEMEAAAALLGNKETTLNNFCMLLRSYIDSESYSPETICRGGVQVLAPTQIRGLKFPRVVVLGMQEGEFPRSISNDWVINDRERLEIRPEASLPTSRELHQREKVLWQMILDACREQLWLTYPAIDDDGQAVLASLYIEEIAAQLSKPLAAADPRPQEFPDDWQDSCSRREITLSLLHQGYKDIGYCLAETELGRSNNLLAVEKADSLRWGSDFSSWDGCFKSEETIALLGEQQKKRIFNISNLNTYANCPMKYFLSVELGLKPLPRQENAINHLDKGMLQHEVLQRVFAGKIPNDDKEIIQLVEDTLNKVCAENNFLGQQYPHPFLWEHDKKVMRDNIANLTMAEMQRLSKGNYEPKYMEWGFGLQSEKVDPASAEEPLTVVTPYGTVRLRGKIDRIDINAKDNSYVVYDYKNKTAESREKVLQGRALQLPAYLLAVEKFLGPVAGAAYLNITKGKIDTPLVKAESVQQLGLSRRTKAVTGEEWEQLREITINAMGCYYEGISAGKFPPLPNDCSYCEFSSLCLYSPGRIRAKLHRKESADDEF